MAKSTIRVPFLFSHVLLQPKLPLFCLFFFLFKQSLPSTLIKTLPKMVASTIPLKVDLNLSDGRCYVEHFSIQQQQLSHLSQVFGVGYMN